MESLLPIALFSTGLSLVYAVGELVDRRPGIRNWLLSTIYVTLALTLGHAYLLTTGQIIAFPHLLHIHTPLTYAMGPCLNLYLRLSIDREARISTRFYWHLIPAVFVAFAMIPHYLLDDETKMQLVSAFLRGETPGYTTYFYFGGMAQLCAYLLLLVYQLQDVLTRESLQRESSARITLLITGWALLATVTVLLGFATRNLIILRSTLLFMSTLVPVLYWIQRRHPGFFLELETAVQKERYRRSQLGGLDLSGLQSRLERLMREDRIYLREDLTLPALAEQLGATPHQLSEYFNRHQETNFAGYINRRRIAVGCNSKSAFNPAFARHTGQSPSAYRRSHSRGHA